MGADFSRVRLNPLLDYAGVELKQGGVLLDADFNELVAIARPAPARAGERRAGPRHGVVDHARRLQASAVARRRRCTIGRGRLYVDGLLAENHGAASNDPAKRLFDPLLAERQFADPIPYAAQPYLPSPPALPTAGRHLVYLDVWQREVTHLEQPDLVESAVGVDDHSRMQTVWQVRVLAAGRRPAPPAPRPTATSLAGSTLIAPSTGVLTTGTFEVAPVDDPCELPPTGGYRGLENQLYRVEIHDPGQPGGTATFKWSRDNASVGSRVASMISAQRARARDARPRRRAALQRPATGSRSSTTCASSRRRPARCARSRSTRRRAASPSRRRCPPTCCPAAFPNSAFPAARNLRVRRWDQRGAVLPHRRQRHAGPGAGPRRRRLDRRHRRAGGRHRRCCSRTASRSRFASTGAKGFRAGDYWVFAARTADASVELLDRRAAARHPPPLRAARHLGRRRGHGHRLPPPLAADRRGPRLQLHAPASRPNRTPAASSRSRTRSTRCSETGGTVCLGPGQYRCRSTGSCSTARAPSASAGRARQRCSPRRRGAFVIAAAASPSASRTWRSWHRAASPPISVQTALGLVLRQLVMAVLRSADDARLGDRAAGHRGRRVASRDNAIIRSGRHSAPTIPPRRVPKATTRRRSWWRPRSRSTTTCCGAPQQAIGLDGNVLHLLGYAHRRQRCDRLRAGRDQRAGPAACQAPRWRSARNSFIDRRQRHPLRRRRRLDRRATSSSTRRLQRPTRRLRHRRWRPGSTRTASTSARCSPTRSSGFGEAGIVIGAPVRELIVQAQHHRELRQRHRVHRRRQCRLAVDREQSSAQHRFRARGRAGIAGGHWRNPRAVGDHRRQHDPLAGHHRRSIGPAASASWASASSAPAFPATR